MVQLQVYNNELLFTSGERHATLLRADQKFLLVPAVFMVLRVWDIIASVMVLYVDVKEPHVWLTYLDVSVMYVCVCVHNCMLSLRH